jgi:excisionase family DNA binding protein
MRPEVHDLYSIEQVASLLRLHVRTVRNYVREGRLKATRIGKQYRIARADLEAFAGPDLVIRPTARRERHVEASSVVHVDAISPDDAARVTNTLLAAVKKRDGDAPLRVDSLYDEERGSLKVILIGSAPTTAALLKIIAALTEAP